MGRVEVRRGGNQKAAPFPRPAHRTGRARFRHPALRQVSPPGSRRSTYRFLLRLAIQLPLKPSDRFRCLQAHRQSPHLGFFASTPEVRVLPSASITRHPRYCDPLRVPAEPPSLPRTREFTSARTGVPPITQTTFLACRAHYPGGPEPVPASVTSRSVRPSPFLRRVGVHDFTFEACSGFTRVTACKVARPPWWPSSQGSDLARYQTKPLVSYQTYRQLSGWDFHPPVICAVGAH